MENKVTEASYLYDWSEDREELQGEGPCILLPCAALVNYFGLFRRGPFIWENASGEIVSYCLIGQETESRALLFDADLLNEYLDKKLHDSFIGNGLTQRLETASFVWRIPRSRIAGKLCVLIG